MSSETKLCCGCKKNVDTELYRLNEKTNAIYSRCEECRTARSIYDKKVYRKIKESKGQISELNIDHSHLFHAATTSTPPFQYNIFELIRSQKIDPSVQGVISYHDEPILDSVLVHKGGTGEFYIGYPCDVVKDLVVHSDDFKNIKSVSVERLSNGKIYDIDTDINDEWRVGYAPLVGIGFNPIKLQIECDDINKVSIKYGFILFDTVCRTTFGKKTFFVMWGKNKVLFNSSPHVILEQMAQDKDET